MQRDILNMELVELVRERKLAIVANTFLDNSERDKLEVVIKAVSPTGLIQYLNRRDTYFTYDKELDNFYSSQSTNLPYKLLKEFYLVALPLSPSQEDKPLVVEGGSAEEMTKELLIYIFKKVSLMDLSECTFDYNEEPDGYYIKCWCNAELNGRVVDAIQYDRNIFYMMNNDGTFNPLNPMIDAYKAIELYCNTPPSKEQGKYEGGLSDY